MSASRPMSTSMRMSASMPDTASALVDGLAIAALAAARRFADGATMWCVAPDSPAHGRHVAVEFVHPVIVGKRALPAVHIDAVDTVDLVGTIRLLARPGDLLLVIEGADHEGVHRLLARAGAWGLTSVWLGGGARPCAPKGARVGAGAHVLWLDECDATACRAGDIVLLYHVLWELTHVAFEHPGLLPPTSGADAVCVTCSDEALAGEVVSVPQHGVADVIVAGRPTPVNVSLVDDVVPGDLVLVHAGVALARLAEASS